MNKIVYLDEVKKVHDEVKKNVYQIKLNNIEKEEIRKNMIKGYMVLLTKYYENKE